MYKRNEMTNDTPQMMALIIFRRNKTLTEYKIKNICWYLKKKKT